MVLVPAFLALAAAVAIAGCGGGGSSAATGGKQAGQAEGKAQPGGTLQIADSSEPLSLNPATVSGNPSIHAMLQVVEPLFAINQEGKTEPWLAESAKPSKDLKTWTLKIRKGVKFSDGKPLTAADVVFSLEALRKSAAHGSSVEMIKSVRETSPLTVVITTTEPAGKLEGPLSLPYAAIVPENWGGESEKEFESKPIGTGPFMVGSWKRGEALTMEKNPHYWRSGEPVLSKLVFNTVTDANSRMTQLRSGELDVIASPDWSQLPSLESTSGLAVGTYALGYSDSVGLNMTNPLFKDPRVREAVDLAIDREGIVSAALADHGEPASAYFTPAVEYHDASIKPPAQDIAKAKSLLAEAVKEKGLSPSFTLMFISGETFNSTATQIIQQNLEEAGFKVTLQPLDESALLSQASAGKFEAYFVYLSSDIVDPSQLTSNWIGTGGFWTGAETAAAAKLASEANASSDEKDRRSLYYRFQEEVDKENSFISVDYRPFVWAMKSDVTGFNVNSTGNMWLGEAGFTE